jgi:3',5'-cyclic-AMP phosphodiesterase
MTSRRDFFKRTTLAGLGTLLVPDLVTEQKKKQRALRIAHFTDVHILDQPNAEQCFARVLREINALDDRPDFIVNTGDSVRDENEQTRERVEVLWKTWNRITTANNKLPIHSALGNHDVWTGPDATTDAIYKDDKRYGKAWAIEMLGLPGRYYSFIKKGWKFIALDSINGESGYQLDQAQFQWLTQELKAAGEMPVCIYNHVPILAIGPMLYDTKRKPLSEIRFPEADLHKDHQQIKDLFLEYKNVRLCLSGHVHYIDHVEYLGVKYLCNGAVSGNWWRDPLILDDFPPVYAIIDLYTDGSTNVELKFYDFKA